ncbi:MAG: site-specific integrase, partial [Planctomycetes bacterium]|nr:site-specific integrase [Planctomycetota bacterium]
RRRTVSQLLRPVRSGWATTRPQRPILPRVVPARGLRHLHPIRFCPVVLNPQRVPAAEYTPHTYAHAVRVAAGKAKVPHWHPNQLRHLFATEVRKEHGLEAAQVLLGHSRADVTQIYAERNEELAASVAAKIG